MKKKQSRRVKRANNMFLDLGFPPHEAAVMLLRCELAEALRKWMDREAISQVEAAKRLGVVQPASPGSRATRLKSFLWTTSLACAQRPVSQSP